MKLYDEYQAKDTKARPSLTDYSKLLVQMAQKHLDKFFIVVDALDECSEQGRNPFISELEKLRANVFITTRPIPDILDRFQKASQIDVRTNEKDVEKYLASEIQAHTRLVRLTKGDPDLAKDIVNHITQKSSGMYVYVCEPQTSLMKLYTKDR